MKRECACARPRQDSATFNDALGKAEAVLQAADEAGEGLSLETEMYSPDTPGEKVVDAIVEVTTELAVMAMAATGLAAPVASELRLDR